MPPIPPEMNRLVPLIFRESSTLSTYRAKNRFEDSYERNLIALSCGHLIGVLARRLITKLTGKILIMFSPFPTQKAAKPPSAYRWATARPRTRALPVVVLATRPVAPEPEGTACLIPFIASGCRVIKKTLRRSKGAVAVLDTMPVSFEC